MKSYANLSITLNPTDRQKGQISTSRPISESQWLAIKAALHIGAPSDIVAIADEATPEIRAMLHRLLREEQRSLLDDDEGTVTALWRHIKHAIVNPDDVCRSCGSIESLGEDHEKTCLRYQALCDLKQ